MKNQPINTIDDVIRFLDYIITESEKNNDTLGYFAALYQRVTLKVKEGIQTSYFEDGPRMEKLDVIFAKKYIDAWVAWKGNEKTSESWKKAFSFSTKYWPVVLQHLLIGMNAHINFDLGAAAAEISKNQNIEDLKNDFNRINEILSSLVNEVQNNLSTIWPALKRILVKTGKADNILADFSMEVARDGAWEFAKKLSALSHNERTGVIKSRDEKVALISKIITRSKPWLKIILWVVRVGELGSVSEKIKKPLNLNFPQMNLPIIFENNEIFKS
ncbi:MAG TPA: DUF5995 family protein [Draconibacterium sp.]|nr:DUF5995 family protein [Draconibacterium sp.]